MKKAIEHLQNELEALRKELLDSRMKEDKNAEEFIKDIHADIAEFEKAIEILQKH
jgi:ribosomal protein L29